MNRYSWWKYLIIAIALLVGLVYTLPNLYGEAPAVQLSSGKATIKLTEDSKRKAEEALKAAGLTPDLVQFDGASVRARFEDTDTQIKARDALIKAFNPDPANADYIVALNLVSRTPNWLRNARVAFVEPRPMYLGLDLRGGVHFLFQVNMKAALKQKIETYTNDARTLMRTKDIRHSGIRQEGLSVILRLKDQAMQAQAKKVLQEEMNELTWAEQGEGEVFLLVGALSPQNERNIQEQALKQNITTLHNRINELGVAEPVIQQQGLDRIVVQLPGVQDPARAKDILGRTATLQVRMVEAHDGEMRARNFDPEKVQAARNGVIPPGTELHIMDRGDGQPREYLLLNKYSVFTGDDLTRAEPSPDQEAGGSWVVDISLNARGGAAMKEATREGIKRRLAVLLIEKEKPEVLTAPVIQSELGNRFNISGMRNAEEANTLALLMRAGSLAAPMDIIEERTVGPSLGAENIEQGFKSLVYGFAAIAVFMIFYYLLFGVFSTIALSVNLLLLVAVLSMLQATLTLPGIAAIALTLGMAIDSNVLINERVREELRNGSAPQSAISAGYEHAWATILDSNVTTLIAGLSLLAFGSGPVRGFAVVHCLGILTSMFSAVFFSRGLVNLWYGRQKKLKSVSIGQVWKPQA